MKKQTQKMIECYERAIYYSREDNCWSEDMMFFPEVIQVTPHEDYTVDILFQDGRNVIYDAKPLLNEGCFRALQDKEFFINRCKVMNHTLAWDLSGKNDPTNCLDLDPEALYNSKNENLG